MCERKKTCDLDSDDELTLSLLMMLTQNGVPKIANWTSFSREGGSSRVYLPPTFDVTFQDPWLNTTRKLCVCLRHFSCSIELCVFVCLSHSGGPKRPVLCVHCLDTRNTNPCAFHLFSSFKKRFFCFVLILSDSCQIVLRFTLSLLFVMQFFLVFTE